MKRRSWIVLGLLVAVVAVVAWNHRFGVPEDFATDDEQFKYGSVGADHPLATAPLPYWLWKVLPQVAPPSKVMGPDAPRNTLTSYEAFGLVQEKHMQRPIGFSRRAVFGLDFVGLNCSFCHLTTVREAPGAEQQVVLGGTGNTVDIRRYFLFMFAALAPGALDADRTMDAARAAAQAEGRPLNIAERLLYRYVFLPLIPRIVTHLKEKDFKFLTRGSPEELPSFGPGRVDTWALYKRVFDGQDAPGRIPGIVDFPPLWNQKARTGMRMHWDGNTDVLEERNIVSALAVIGPHVDYLDFPRLMRLSNWSEGLLPPRYQDRMPASLNPADPVAYAAQVERGRAVFASHCADCHAPGGLRVGRVEPLADLGTDDARLKDFTPQLAAALNQIGTDEWKLRHFKVQNGYVNNLLDGIWLRGPYLHNGSVPTLRDLLNDPKDRPRTFCRGSDVMNWKDVGFDAGPPNPAGPGDCGALFFYDTRPKKPDEDTGNRNDGHLYGTGLPAADKDALLEFLKTL